MENKYIEICTSKGISIVDSLNKHEAHLIEIGLLKDNSAASVYGVWEQMANNNDGSIVAKHFVGSNLKTELLEKGVVDEYVKWILEGDFDKESFFSSKMYQIEQKADSLKLLPNVTARMAGQIFIDVLDSNDFESPYYRMVTYGILPFGRTSAKE